MYFISKNDKKEGPLTLTELQQKRLTDDVLVWKEGMSDWCKIDEIPELKELVIVTPPPLPSEIQSEKNREKEKKINKQKKEETRSIIEANAILAVLIAAVVSYCHNEATYGSNWPDEYHIFHSLEEKNNHLLTYIPIFFVWLIICAIIACIVAVIKIARVKPTERKYITDKGVIIVLQTYPNRINNRDTVFDLSGSFVVDGKYKFADNNIYPEGHVKYIFIEIRDGYVISQLTIS